MAITTSMSFDKWEETTKDILFEWLTDSSCFQGAGNTFVNVVPYRIAGKETLDIPRCEYDIINVLNASTGAGRQKKNAVFRNVTVEIALKTSRATGENGRKAELDLVEKSDILDKYTRSIKGIPALGGAKLKNAMLHGPIPVENKYYYQRNFILTFRIEVV